ncbi:DNA primase [bacteria symbiont BFo2 of Frankliniella occidentalis]|nr:DNA primase [bacteria symbiont BFo2 of Frankliniella occidentalis]KYP91586.1 DNA primase [bacteria symbiont BFo2 of Frankliniella occidentalis]KYP96674.1 DNA primase [bacteria symbiont BFo2 of Frankliniella occidentalis]
MRTVEAVNGRWGEVFNHYQLPPITGKNHFKGECPICGKRGRFRIDDKDGKGTFICICKSGNGWTLLEETQGKDFKTLAREVDRIIGNQYKSDNFTKPEPPRVDQYRARVAAKFAELTPIRKTHAETYFSNRGLKELPFSDVKFFEKEKIPEGVFDSIWSIAIDDKGEGCYLHRTFIDGGQKAKFEANRKLKKLQEDSYLEHARSVAIRMFPVSTTLGISEGIETALSCKQLYGCNTWATMNTNFMKKFKAPKGVEHLIIFADSDSHGAGLAAAFECGNKNILSNNDVKKVSVRWPERGDFNDMLIDGSKVYQQILTRN